MTGCMMAGLSLNIKFVHELLTSEWLLVAWLVHGLNIKCVDEMICFHVVYLVALA